MEHYSRGECLRAFPSSDPRKYVQYKFGMQRIEHQVHWDNIIREKRRPYFQFVCHQIQKFRKLNSSVSISINLLDHILQFRSSEVLTQGLHHSSQFFASNESCIHVSGRISCEFIFQNLLRSKSTNHIFPRHNSIQLTTRNISRRFCKMVTSFKQNTPFIWTKDHWNYALKLQCTVQLFKWWTDAHIGR